MRFRLLCFACLATGTSFAQTAPTEPAAAGPGLAPPRWEGAVGLTTAYQPEYPGAARHTWKTMPALFLRWDRFTVTNASGFVTRRADDVVRGLGLDMVRRADLRVNLALRFDAGRRESTSPDLAGLGDVKPTVRVRFGATWRPGGGPWRVDGSWSVDAFGRGGGNYGEASVARELRLAPHTSLTAGAGLALAGDRYLQAYYGVSAEQSVRSRYPVYTPASGLRDGWLFAHLRHDIGDDWTLLGGAHASRLLGPAADSPLTQRRSGWTLSGGLARRF